jgi:hypothetical protein
MATVADHRLHRGMRAYSSEEMSNIIASQGGTNILTGANTTAGITYIANTDAASSSTIKYYPDVKYWISIKAPLGSNTQVQAVSRHGDDLALNGTYASTGTTNNVNLQSQDEVHGVFTRIRISGGTTTLIAVKG